MAISTGLNTVLSSGETIRLPPWDPQIVAVKDTQHRPIPANLEELHNLRKEEPPYDDTIYNDETLSVEEMTIPGRDCNISVIVVQSKQATARNDTRPGILFFHGGGRVMGNVYVGLAAVMEAVKKLDAVVVSVNYRLSPEVHGLKTVQDCYDSLIWLSQNIDSLSIDPTRLMIAGYSAGAGLAAGTALMARDHEGPKLCAQLLACPMLDDRCTNLSCRQFEDGRGFYTAWNRYAWSCVLGKEADRGNVSIYVAPGRADDLSNLPPAYIDTASGEPFRDEDIAYATKLWECGTQTDLHVWGGGCHGFELFYPTELGAEAVAARTRWLIRILGA